MDNKNKNYLDKFQNSLDMEKKFYIIKLII